MDFFLLSNSNRSNGPESIKSFCKINCSAASALRNGKFSRLGGGESPPYPLCFVPGRKLPSTEISILLNNVELKDTQIYIVDHWKITYGRYNVCEVFRFQARSALVQDGMWQIQVLFERRAKRVRYDFCLANNLTNRRV